MEPAIMHGPGLMQREAVLFTECNLLVPAVRS